MVYENIIVIFNFILRLGMVRFMYFVLWYLKSYEILIWGLFLKFNFWKFIVINMYIILFFIFSYKYLFFIELDIFIIYLNIFD